mgnify:CR=1 FL=1
MPVGRRAAAAHVETLGRRLLAAHLLDQGRDRGHDPVGGSLHRDRAGALLVVLPAQVGQVDRVAHRLVTEPDLRAGLDAGAADAAVFVVERYGQEVTAVITHTIERWDGREAAERIELHVGRDLQFIRINGTIVGGLVGVLIHTLDVLLP